MHREVVSTETTTHIDLPKHTVVELIKHTAEQHKVKFDPESLEAYRETFLARMSGLKFNYRIEEEEGEEGFRVVEEEIRGLQYYLFWLAPISVMALFTLNYHFEVYTASAREQATILTFSIGSILLWMGFVLDHASPLMKARHKVQGWKKRYCVADAAQSLAGGFYLVSGSAVLFNLGDTLVVTGFAAFVIVASATLLSVLTGRGLADAMFEPRFRERLPLFTMRLVSAQGLVVTTGLFLLYFRVLRENSLNPLVDQYQSFFFFIALIFVYAFAWFVKNQAKHGASDFEEVGSTGSAPAKIAVAVFSVGLSFTTLLIGFLVFRLVVLPWYLPALIRWAGVVSVLAVLYFPVGVAYQTYSQVRHTRDGLRKSSNYTGESLSKYPVKVIRPSKEEYFAASLYTGKNSYIIVSQSILEDFTREEVEAVVAHEEAHIENGDTKLAALVLALSAVTLVGRNVYYGLIDFKKRELAADQYAKQKTSADALTSALDKSDKQIPPSLPTGLGFTPVFGNFPSPEGLELYFDLFFGDYTLREAHPDPDERIKALE